MCDKFRFQEIHYLASFLSSLQVNSRAIDYRFVSRLRPDVDWVSFVDRKSLEMSVPGAAALQKTKHARHHVYESASYVHYSSLHVHIYIYSIYIYIFACLFVCMYK